MLATLVRCFDVSLAPFNLVPGSCCDGSLREISDQTVVLVLIVHVLRLLSSVAPITSIFTDSSIPFMSSLRSFSWLSCISLMILASLGLLTFFFKKKFFLDYIYISKENRNGLGDESLDLHLILKFLSNAHSLHTLHHEIFKIGYCSRNSIFACWLGLLVARLTNYYLTGSATGSTTGSASGSASAMCSSTILFLFEP